jgi:hypothetical protein
MVEAGLTLTITCEAPIDHSEPYRSLISNQRLSWEIPDNIKKVGIIRTRSGMTIIRLIISGYERATALR